MHEPPNPSSSRKLRLLFICSRNQWRSPTAEAIWKRSQEYECRSAGTSPQARKTVSTADLRWADVIFVMENKHKQRLSAAFRGLLADKLIRVLGIPDEYAHMNPELIAELKNGVRSIIGTS
jgi:predicted protein tyrosine phosphatase